MIDGDEARILSTAFARGASREQAAALVEWYRREAGPFMRSVQMGLGHRCPYCQEGVMATYPDGRTECIRCEARGL